MGKEYDSWTDDGVLEHYWGEHIHLGYYSEEVRCVPQRITVSSAVGSAVGRPPVLVQHTGAAHSAAAHITVLCELSTSHAAPHPRNAVWVWCAFGGAGARGGLQEQGLHRGEEGLRV